MGNNTTLSYLWVNPKALTSQIHSSQVPLPCIYFRNMWFCLSVSHSTSSFLPILRNSLHLCLSFLSDFLYLTISLLVVWVFSAVLPFDGKIKTLHRTHVHLTVCVCVLMLHRSRKSPGRGGLLFPRCPRMPSGRPGACLQKRYYNPAVLWVLVSCTWCPVQF